MKTIRLVRTHKVDKSQMTSYMIHENEDLIQDLAKSLAELDEESEFTYAWSFVTDPVEIRNAVVDKINNLDKEINDKVNKKHDYKKFLETLN